MKRRNTRVTNKRLIEPKESAIQTGIEKYLIFMENMGKLVYQKNNTGAVKVEGRFIRFGKDGSSDFLVYLPKGETLHLEVKTSKGRQTDNQKKYQKDVEALGHEYYIARSPDNAIEKIKEKLGV